MSRCLQLARLGAGYVAPNPMVGAVLVHKGLIIGEGYHKIYGGPHAEVNCLNSVDPENLHLISKSILYVSLEPCAHHGKTPPCADLVIRNNIPEVIIGCSDSYADVDGKGIERLKQAGVKVTTGILHEKARELNKRFFTFHESKRPYILLKWAQTADGFIAHADYRAILVSNELSNRYTHSMRAHESAIMVGAKTALYDNPSLTTRYWPGQNPVRIVIDKGLQLTPGARIFDKQAPTIIFTNQQKASGEKVEYHVLGGDIPLTTELMNLLKKKNLTSVIIEGGTALIQSFIDQGLWDEALVIVNTKLSVGAGIQAPLLKDAVLSKEWRLKQDHLQIFTNR